jgi:hypothetical protein
LKRFVGRLRPVFDEGRYCGALVHSARGWIIYSPRGDPCRLYRDAEKAVKRLRTVAARQST